MKRKFDNRDIMLSQYSQRSVASVSVDNRAAGADEDTTFYYKSYCRPNRKNFGAKVGKSRAALLRDAGIKHLYDDRVSAGEYAGDYNRWSYMGVFNFQPFADEDTAPDIGLFSLGNALRYIGRGQTPQSDSVDFTTVLRRGIPIYLKIFKYKKYYVNTTNVTLEVQVVETLPRQGAAYVAAHYVNSQAQDDIPSYASSGFDYNLAVRDTIADDSYPFSSLLTGPHYHWSHNPYFTKHYKVIREKSFKIPPGGKICISQVFDFDQFVDQQTMFRNSNTYFTDMPQILIRARGELVLSGAPNDNTAFPVYPPARLSSYMSYYVSGAALNPLMFPNTVDSYGQNLLSFLPASVTTAHQQKDDAGDDAKAFDLDM